MANPQQSNDMEIQLQKEMEGISIFVLQVHIFWFQSNDCITLFRIF